MYGAFETNTLFTFNSLRATYSDFLTFNRAFNTRNLKSCSQLLSNAKITEWTIAVKLFVIRRTKMNAGIKPKTIFLHRVIRNNGTRAKKTLLEIIPLLVSNDVRQAISTLLTIHAYILR